MEGLGRFGDGDNEGNVETLEAKRFENSTSGLM